MTTPLPVQVPIDVLAQFRRVTDYWSPKVVTRVNDQYVKVARLLGEMDWHSHADEDELFWVVRGRMRLEFRNGAAELSAGQCCVVPRGVEHHPVAEEECWIVLIEPKGTLNTGNVVGERTVAAPERI